MNKNKKAQIKFASFIAGVVVSLGVIGYNIGSDIIYSVKESDWQTPSFVDDTKKNIKKAQEISLGSISKELKEELGQGENTSKPASSTSSETASEKNEDTFLPTTSGTVTRVVDGDTYILNIDGTDVRVRLIGVDTPESVAPDSYRKENSEEGKEISELVKEKVLEGDTLYIEYDVSPTDKYGRTLAYLYFPDGTMVQDWLLQNGYANVATYAPNVKYADHFSELAHAACEEKVGLWNGFFTEE